jgi:hypothetical protein
MEMENKEKNGEDPNSFCRIKLCKGVGVVLEGN